MEPMQRRRRLHLKRNRYCYYTITNDNTNLENVDNDSSSQLSSQCVLKTQKIQLLSYTLSTTHCFSMMSKTMIEMIDLIIFPQLIWDNFVTKRITNSLKVLELCFAKRKNRHQSSMFYSFCSLSSCCYYTLWNRCIYQLNPLSSDYKQIFFTIFIMFTSRCNITVTATTIRYEKTTNTKSIFTKQRRLTMDRIMKEMIGQTIGNRSRLEHQSEITNTSNHHDHRIHHQIVQEMHQENQQQLIHHNVDEGDDNDSVDLRMTTMKQHNSAGDREQEDMYQNFDNNSSSTFLWHRRRIDSSTTTTSTNYTGNYTTNTNMTNSSLYEHNNNPNKGVLQIQSFCKHNYVQITSLQLLCDTPGAYYFGSNAYRKSEVCQSGDKAYIEMDFIVPNRMVDRTIYMQVEFGLYDRFQVVNTSVLCSLPVTLIKAFPIKFLQGPIITDDMVYNDNNTTETTTDDDTTVIDDDDYYVNDDAFVLSRCTNVSGRYHLSTFYYVPKIHDNNFHYTPDIRLTFTDVQARKVGCTVSGPYSLLVENDTRSERGYIALAISCCIFIFVFAFLLIYNSSYGKKLLSKNSTNKTNCNANPMDDDDDDYEILRTTRKAILAQRRRLHNLNQYQYFRTLPNGQVIPLPGLQPIPPKTPTHSSTPPKDGEAAASSSTFFGALAPSQQHFYYYKSPRPVITVTRHVPTTATVTTATAENHQSTAMSSSAVSQNISSQQYQLPAYLQNMPNSSTTDDDESHDDDDDDDDDGHQLTSNPQYNETHLPTRPVI